MIAQQPRFIRALLRQPVDQTPIWLMRQAGRYLPEYRRVRQSAGNFITLCKTPELACEVTLQPLARFPLDAAIIFSDILTIPDAMGLGLYFAEQEGPKFHRPIRKAEDIHSLRVPEPSIDLHYVLDAIRLTRRALPQSIPLIGFSGSPWTLATYMIEGGSSKTFGQIKRWLYNEPKTLHQLLSLLAISVTEYLSAQIQAGVQAVMLFDTWGGILTPQAYQAFSLSYMTQIIQALKQRMTEKTPIIIFTKHGGQWLPKMADSGCDAIGLDWTTSLQVARQQVGDRVALQGNLDPAALYADPLYIEQEVDRILTEYGVGSGHIFNLGHGVHPDTPPEHVSALIDAVQRLSRPYHNAVNFPAFE